MAGHVSLHHQVFVIHLGRIAYHHAWNTQQILARRYLDHLKVPVLGPSKPRDSILICEHEPVYTIGVRSRDFLVSEEQRLKNLGAHFHRTNRGGLITFHGPGQLVAYPILNLHHFKKSVRWYISQLERTVIHTCQELGVKAGTSCDTGVWVKDNKLAAIGIQCSRYITTHGLGLNCNTDLSWFDNIVPCGLKDKGITSLARELQRDVPVHEVLPVFLKAFAKEFNCSIVEADA
ncbi:putative lipoyltransferase 2, mitochondrial [Asterias rubens]|uniref:putative lipoyltransferase 2, mitochondrial n=1 Tax=Asterias rubens TaxID=7604 RepID=UPI001455C9DB|nr:putative lipoyltransferase 2, mitochondrial [Asterias rubens]